MVSIIVTLLLVGLLLWGVTKRMNAAFLLLILGLGSIFVMELITGVSVMGKTASGNLLFDVFEFFQTTAASQLSRNVLIVMTVMGYVYYMEEIKASTMFAVLVSKPFQKMKNPYLLVSMVIFLGCFLKLGITSASSLTAMLLATMYPVLRSAGLSRNTSAAAMTISGSIVWGPADANWYMAFSLAKITNMTVPVFFVKYMIPIVIVIVVVLAVTMSIFSKYYDKKEGAAANENDIFNIESIGSVESLGIPKFYAIFPLLPLVVILIWSGIFPISVKISVVAAHILCFVLVMAVNMIVKKNFQDVFNQASAYFGGMGKYFTLGGIIMITATIFAQGLTNIGGLKVLGELIGNSGIIALMVVASILGFFIAAFSHLTPVLTIFVPLIAVICAVTGTNIVYPLLSVIFGGCMGINVYACNSALIIASGATGMSIPALLKRNFFPSVITLIAVIATSLIMMAVSF